MRVLALVLFATALPAAPAPPPWWELDGTRIALTVRGTAFTAGAILRGHARAPADGPIELALHPGLTLTKVESSLGAASFVREGRVVRIALHPPPACGARFHLSMDWHGSLGDPARAPGPTPGVPHAPGIASHLDPDSGLVLPREDFWYPRPPGPDRQELALRVTVPRSWELTTRLFKEHEIPAPGGCKAVLLRSRGITTWPIGLAAGPFEIEARPYGPATVRLFRYAHRLAEAPPSTALWAAVDELMAEHASRLGDPVEGRYDLVELAGPLAHPSAATFLSQGSFAWVVNPTGRVDDGLYAFLGRELARFWWERTVRVANRVRGALCRFSALLAIRARRGEGAFLAGCRAEAAEHHPALYPGPTLLAADPRDWEAAHPATGRAGNPAALVVLLSLLQRQGQPALEAAMRDFATRYRGRAAELVDLLDPLEAATGL